MPAKKQPSKPEAGLDLDELFTDLQDSLSELSDALESADADAEDRVREALEVFSNTDMIQRLQSQAESGVDDAQEHWDRLVSLLRDAANKGYVGAKNLLDKYGLGLGLPTED